MEELDIKKYTIGHIRTAIKIVKPWRMNSYSNEVESIAYENGWNDCIKLMNHNAKKLLKHYEKL